MAIKKKPFFYDAQTKRYLLQIMSCFAGYQVKTGLQRDGKPRFINCPIMFGTYDRVVAFLKSDGNINKEPSLPVMSLEIKGMRQADDLRRAPDFTSNYMFKTRAPATLETTLGSAEGEMMMAERPMPVPYIMTTNLNIWASNHDQLLQLTEQIGYHFNPTLDIMLSNSPADWTFLSYLKFMGDISFRRTALDIGGGTGSEQLHLAEMDFETLVHLSAPVKVKKASYIEKITTNMRHYEHGLDVNDMSVLDGFVIDVDDEFLED
jgi:hypothetical protein